MRRILVFAVALIMAALSVGVVSAQQRVIAAWSMGDGAHIEGSGIHTVSLGLDLSASTAETKTVDYTVTAVSAALGSDFTFVNGTATAGSNTSTSITFDILGDDIVERDETFIITLSNPTNSAIGNSSATITIANDDYAFNANPGFEAKKTGWTFGYAVGTAANDKPKCSSVTPYGLSSDCAYVAKGGAHEKSTVKQSVKLTNYGFTFTGCENLYFRTDFYVEPLTAGKFFSAQLKFKVAYGDGVTPAGSAVMDISRGSGDTVGIWDFTATPLVQVASTNVKKITGTLTHKSLSGSVKARFDNLELFIQNPECTR